MTKAGAGHPFGAVRSRTDGPDTENGLYGDLGSCLCLQMQELPIVREFKKTENAKPDL